jgi:hypothetical protein
MSGNDQDWALVEMKAKKRQTPDHLLIEDWQASGTI